MRFDLRVNNWRSYLPIWDVIARYRRTDFNHDLVAGLVVGVVTVPQAIAYAFLAGLPPQAGLYACLVPMILYALLGSSRHLVVGPVAIAALMVASAVGKYAPQYSDAYLGVTTIICLQSGIFLWLLRLWKMGGLVNLLSHPVIVGFVNAAALLIIISQLAAFAGIPAPAGENSLARVMDLARHAGAFNPMTLFIGLISLALLLVIQQWGCAGLRRLGWLVVDGHPVSRTGPMLVVVLAVLVTGALQLDSRFGIAVVGEVPSGLPAFTLPPFDLDLWRNLAPVSAMIAFVSYIESFSIGTTLATRERTRLNSHQELIALGAANIGAAFTGAYPVAGSFSRSSVNYQAGARTPVSSLVCSLVIVLTLIALTPLFRNLPHATLAAIVMVSVVGLMDFRRFRQNWVAYREDGITQIMTLLTVLLFGVEAGLLTGVALSIAFFVRTASRPQISLVGRVGESTHFRTQRRHEVATVPQVAAVRIDENLFFANANQVENKLTKIIERRPQTRHMLLVCSSINMVDISGMEMLQRVNANFAKRGVTLHLSDVKAAVMDQLRATGFTEALSGAVFFTTDEAMRDLAERDH